jgi:FkbM family methyltransferase
MSPPQLLSIKKRIANALPGLYTRYDQAFRRFEYSTFSAFIDEYSKRRKGRISFLQIGGNDGVTWDPYHFFIQRDEWTGIVVEPQKEVFERRLKRTYAGNPRVELLNVAVDARDGERPLYKYSFSTSRWATGLASFDKENLIDNFPTEYVQSNIRKENVSVGSDPDEYLTTEMVPCVSFATILARWSHPSIDFLITDTERFDIPILSTFPLERIKPRNIAFEHATAFDDVFSRFLAKLKSHGYRILIDGNDCIAVLPAESVAAS